MPKLIFFTAPYCAPCRAIKPAVQDYATRNNFEFVEVDTQANRDEAARYGITVTPVLISQNSITKIYHGKEAIDKFLIGEVVPSKQEILSLLIKGGITAIGSFIVAQTLTKIFINKPQ